MLFLFSRNQHRFFCAGEIGEGAWLLLVGGDWGVREPLFMCAVYHRTNVLVKDEIVTSLRMVSDESVSIAHFCTHIHSTHFGEFQSHGTSSGIVSIAKTE